MTQSELAAIESRKSNLLIQAALLRDQGDLDQSCEAFAKAAAIEEALARDADAHQDVLTAIRLWYSAASAWAHAGDFHHAVTLLRELQGRQDVPASMKARIAAFSLKVLQQRERWRDTLHELASA